MSLQVWLPLNGDLRNQGISDVTVTNNDATINTSGKIGSCYEFNGSGYLKESTYDWTNFNTSTFSLCCWYKEPSPVASGNSQIICVGTSSGWNNIRFGLLRRTSNGYPMFSVSNGSSAIQYNFTANSFTLDTWNHIAITYDNGHIIMYLNGQFHKEMTTTIVPTLNSSQHLGIGGASNGAEKLTGFLNDVRIYDHCLSDKEIEEIAKGLVLHYKLDDPYIESTTLLSSTINETAYNASISKYGYNDTSNLIKTTGVFQGKQCIKVGTRVAGQTAKPYAYFSNLFTSDGTNAPAYKALSFDYYTTVPTTTWLNIYKLGNGSGTATWKTTNKDGVWSGTYTNSSNAIIVSPNQWNHIEVVLHGTTEANAEWGYCINGPEHTSSADYYFLYANIQLEQNDHITGYKNNELYHSLTVYDNSGCGNNGTIVGSLETTMPSARYNYTTKFNGTSYIYTTSPCVEVKTVSLWVKWDTIPSGQSVVFLDAKSHIGLGLMSTGILCITSGLGSGNTFSKANLVANTWYHFVVVNPGGTTDIPRKLYINGIEQTATSNTSNWTYSIDQTQIGKRSTTSDGFVGSLNDVRLYSSVLTLEQILELYNTSASIDRSGNIYAREVNEP